MVCVFCRWCHDFHVGEALLWHCWAFAVGWVVGASCHVALGVLRTSSVAGMTGAWGLAALPRDTSLLSAHRIIELCVVIGARGPFSSCEGFAGGVCGGVHLVQQRAWVRPCRF